MSEATRQAKRRERRELEKTGSILMRRGIKQVPAPLDLVAVAAVVLAKFREVANPRRASEAAALAQNLAEVSLKAQPPRVSIACTKGCSYCCHTFVAITAPEAFRLAEVVRSGRSGLTRDEVLARSARLAGIPPQGRIGTKLPCPLLVDGACSAYAERPLVCRQATSLDLPACLDEFEGTDENTRIPVSSPHLAHASNAHVALLAAMRAAGLPDAPIELGTALGTALSEIDGEARWLAGENIFADAPRLSQRDADADRVTRQIAMLIAS